MTEKEKQLVETPAVETDLTGDIAEVLTEIASEAPVKEKKRRIEMQSEDVVTIDQREYRLAVNYREGFDLDKMNERYSDVLNRYDYIVGDVGFEQLRLKGFFSDNQKKMPVEQRIGSLQDYLYEYCNFGCAYFVLERIGGPVKKERPQNKNKRNNRRNKPKQPAAHLQEKKGQPVDKKQPNRNKKSPVIKNRQAAETKPQGSKPVEKKNQATKNTNRSFTIRQTEGE